MEILERPHPLFLFAWRPGAAPWSNSSLALVAITACASANPPLEFDHGAEFDPRTIADWPRSYSFHGMARLSAEQRSFRKAGAGIPPSRYWPFPVMVIGLFAASADPFLMRACLGWDLPAMHGKAALVALAVVGVCSPLLVKGGVWQCLWFALIWLPAPFAAINARWIRRHRAYWKGVRERESVTRRERKQRARAQQDANAPRAPTDP